MALKADAEDVRDKADRIVRLILARQKDTLLADDNPDAEVAVTPAMKQRWNDRIDELKADIKAIVGGW